MSVLVQTPEGFTLDTRSADECAIGGGDPVTPDTTLLGSGDRAALIPPNRRSFVRGLLSFWNAGAVPVLAPRATDARDASSPLHAPPFARLPEAQLGTVHFDDETVVCELLTSGSTKQPQAFRKTARQLFGEALALSRLLELSPEHTALATTASHHLYGLLFGVLAPMCSGARLVTSAANEPEAFHPGNVAVLAQRHVATHLVSVPAHLRALLEAPIELPSISTIISSAAPLDPVVARELEDKFGAEVIDVLGSTETGGIATRRAAHTRAWSPIPGVRVRLDDDERLLIQSPFLTSPDSEERSDERARLGEDGTFEYLGRADDVVKVAGKRISLGEIEERVRAIPEVTDCACTSRAISGLRGEEILLVVAPGDLKKSSLRAALRKQLDPAFVPRKIRVVSALPRTDRGKPERAALLALFAAPVDSGNIVEKTVTIPRDWARFVGHFQGDPLLPALSQLSDLILPEIRRTFGGGSLASLKRVKWTHAIRPGADLSLRLEKKPTGIGFEISEGPILACSGTAQLHPEGS